MRMYFEVIDMDLQDVIKNGPFVPTKSEVGKIIDKLRNEWDNANKGKVHLNARGKLILLS